MSAYKQFLSSDLIITPFEVNKSFYFSGSSQLDTTINRLIGENTTGLFDPLQDNTTGTVTTEYSNLVYSGIKQLYYSNYIGSDSGSLPSVPYTYLGSNSSGNVEMGDASSAGRFENFLPSTLHFSRFFPTESNAKIGVISIPVKQYGNYIQPGSLKIKSGSFELVDDAQGNLINRTEIYGNIIYEHGIIVISTLSGSGIQLGAVYGTATYGTSVYGTGSFVPSIEDFILYSGLELWYSSSITLYETQIKCEVACDEFTTTLNPTTLVSTSSMQYVDFATGSYFTPYVTSVGLYNEKQELMAIAKMAQPVPLSSTTNTNILINIDR